MTTFAQWRSSRSRPATTGPGSRRKYDTRVLDQFYAYCSAVAHADRHRETAVQLQRAAQRRLWALLIGASILGYYLVERVAQAMSLL